MSKAFSILILLATCIGGLLGERDARSQDTTASPSPSRSPTLAPALTPRGTREVTVDQEGYRFKVQLDPGNKKVTIKSLGSVKKLPPQMSISLFQDETTGQTVRLEAMPPLNPGDSPRYQGEISWYSGPYVAFEIQIPMANHSWKRIRKSL